MNEYAILHIPDSRYCFATKEKELVLRLRMAREDTKAEVFLIHACKYDFTLERQKTKLEICYSDKLYNYYEIKLALKDVRFAYIFQIEENGKIYYYSEDGVTTQYCFEEGFYNFFQMPYINENDLLKTVQWMKKIVFYQIFVDRFRQGDYRKNMEYINMGWEDRPTPKSFAGGDIPGIIEKLDYLKQLGIGGIYLTPVFRSISNHKYDIMDYLQVDPQFGTLQDLKDLVQQAHERGMRVVLDAVFNHCSENLQQFQDVLKKGSASPYYNWFLIDGEKPDQKSGNYECFASCTYMPKFNTANPEVQKFLLEITHYWMKEVDIDGWRLDVSDEVSHDFWRKFRRKVKGWKPDCVIIGENWHDAYPYLMGDQYDSIMNYSFTKACLDYFAKGVFDAKQMAQKLNGNLMRNMEQVNEMMLNLLDSHDTHRFYTEVGCDTDKLVAAVALEMVFMGAPCIYYGTEICMEGGYDPDSRRCFNWEEGNWNRSVLQQIRELIALHGREEIENGAIQITAENELLCVRRIYKEKELWLWINMTEEEKELPRKNQKAGQVLSQNNMEEMRLKAHGYTIVAVESVLC